MSQTFKQSWSLCIWNCSPWQAHLCPTNGPFRYPKLEENFIANRYPALPGQDFGPTKKTDSPPSRFGPYSCYVNAKFFLKTLNKLGISESFKDILDERADFMDIKVPNYVFFANGRTSALHGVLLIFRSYSNKHVYWILYRMVATMSFTIWSDNVND